MSSKVVLSASIVMAILGIGFGEILFKTLSWSSLESIWYGSITGVAAISLALSDRHKEYQPNIALALVLLFTLTTVVVSTALMNAAHLPTMQFVSDRSISGWLIAILFVTSILIGVSSLLNRMNTIAFCGGAIFFGTGICLQIQRYLTLISQ